MPSDHCEEASVVPGPDFLCVIVIIGSAVTPAHPRASVSDVNIIEMSTKLRGSFHNNSRRHLLGPSSCLLLVLLALSHNLLRYYAEDVEST